MNIGRHVLQGTSEVTAWPRVVQNVRNLLAHAADKGDSMVALSRSKLFGRVLASTLACALLLQAGPARADSIAENMEGHWPTEKKVVVWTLLGASVITLGIGAFSFAKSADARASLRDDFPRETNDPRSADCRSAQECAALQSTLDDEQAWGDRLAVSAVVSTSLMLAGILTAGFWSNGSTRIAPSAGQTGAGVLVETRF